MKMPAKLKTILILWAIFGAVWTLIFSVLLLVGVGGTLVGKSTNPLVIDVIIYVITLALIIPGFHFLRIVERLWKGLGKYEHVFRIYVAINMLNFPLGTILGIASLVVLYQTDVRTFLNGGVQPMTKERLVAEAHELKK